MQHLKSCTKNGLIQLQINLVSAGIDLSKGGMGATSAIDSLCRWHMTDWEVDRQHSGREGREQEAEHPIRQRPWDKKQSNTLVREQRGESRKLSSRSGKGKGSEGDSGRVQG